MGSIFDKVLAYLWKYLESILVNLERLVSYLIILEHLMIFSCVCDQFIISFVLKKHVSNY